MSTEGKYRKTQGGKSSETCSSGRNVVSVSTQAMNLISKKRQSRSRGEAVRTKENSSDDSAASCILRDTVKL